MFRRTRETPSQDQRLDERDRRYTHNAVELINPGALTKLYRTLHVPATRRALNGIAGRPPRRDRGRS